MEASSCIECKECARRAEELKKLEERQALRERATASFYHLFDVMTRRSRDVLVEKYNELVPDDEKICAESFKFVTDSRRVDPRVMQEVTDTLGVKFNIYCKVKLRCFYTLSEDYDIPDEPMGFKELRKNFDEIESNTEDPREKHVFKVLKRFLKGELKSLEEAAFL